MNYAENLRVLIAAVEAHPAERFDLTTYRDFEYIESANGCKTLFCAAGLIPTIKHFKDMGVTAMESTGAPTMSREGLEDAMPTLDHLFGTYIDPTWSEPFSAFSVCFATFGAGIYDDKLMPDSTPRCDRFDVVRHDRAMHKELVLRRLRYALEQQS